MRRFDLSPLTRAGVGFEHMTRLMDSLARQDQSSPSYPPYNIEKTGEEGYRVTLAVAGFAEEDLDITVQEGTLTIEGSRKEEAPNEAETYLHRGIAGRPFERRFQLADHIHVTGADLVNGLLHIDLVREVPEASKPRKIAIGKNTDVIEGKVKKAA